MVLSGHEGEVYAAKFSPNGDLIASASFDKNIRMFPNVHYVFALDVCVERNAIHVYAALVCVFNLVSRLHIYIE